MFFGHFSLKTISGIAKSITLNKAAPWEQSDLGLHFASHFYKRHRCLKFLESLLLYCNSTRGALIISLLYFSKGPFQWKC